QRAHRGIVTELRDLAEYHPIDIAGHGGAPAGHRRGHVGHDARPPRALGIGGHLRHTPAPTSCVAPVVSLYIGSVRGQHQENLPAFAAGDSRLRPARTLTTVQAVRRKDEMSSPDPGDSSDRCVRLTAIADGSSGPPTWRRSGHT